MGRRTLDVITEDTPHAATSDRDLEDLRVRIAAIVHTAQKEKLVMLLSLIGAVRPVVEDRLADLRTPQKAPPESRWLKPAEIAHRMGVSTKWLQRRRRLLPFIEPLPDGGRGYRALESRLEDYLTGKRR